MKERKRIAEIRRLIKTGVEQDSDGGYPPHLRGLSHTQLKNPQGLRGIKLGAANKGRFLTAEEKAEVERKLKQEGKL